MSDRQRPATPPRHSMHAASSASAWFPSARQAARIRAIARSDQLPHERALADATVLTAWLTAAQRAEYAPGLRASSDVEEFVARLADERRVVLEEGADPVADEVGSAAGAERSARQIPLRLVETALLLGAVACFVFAVMQLEIDNGLPNAPSSQIVWPVGGVAMTAVLAAIVGRVATRRRDRVMLSWAVGRPGQLGRGVPVQRALQSDSVGPALVTALAPALMVGVGIIGMFAGAAVLLIELLSRDDASMTTFALLSLGLGLFALLAAVVLGRIRSRRLELTLRRARAVEWFGPLLTEPGQEPHDEPRAGLGGDSAAGADADADADTDTDTDTEAYPGSTPP